MQKFATAAPVTAVVEIPAGRIRFVATDRSDATVEVLPADSSKSRDTKAAEQVEVDFTDGVLRVATPAADSRILGDRGSVEVTVQLPAGSRVEGKAAAAELRGEGRLGDVVFEGAYRRIRLDETASLRLTATDGDVEVGRLGGPAEISTQRGAVRIAEAVRGTVALSTQSGDIHIGAARGVSATLDAGTAFGRVSNALRNEGNPELDIRATTSNGDITARSL
ncbi:DUF4097 family beta strand repeat-containing protein [Streptomyces sp. NPDC101158]|uniref:DUF4097 family beta strand repeat-containing protein n=1 Tax=Streptomyces sp. NPDC101158 TaxID=3366117 RepID=UPI00380100AB